MRAVRREMGIMMYEGNFQPTAWYVGLPGVLVCDNEYKYGFSSFGSKTNGDK